MKCGTDDGDVEIINFTSKVVPFGAGYDDGEVESAVNPSGGDSIKRKQVFEEILLERKMRNTNTSELVSTVKEMVSNETTSAINERANDTRHIHEVFTLRKQLNELRQLNDDSTLTRHSIAITEVSLRNAHEKCAHLLN